VRQESNLKARLIDKILSIPTGAVSMGRTDEQQATILVLGAGNFGTSLAQHLATKGANVHLWDHLKEVTDCIRETKHNPKCLSHIELSDRIQAFHDKNAFDLSSCQAIVIAIPTQFLRSVMESFRDLITNKHLLICAAKGIEENTLKLPVEIIEEVLGTDIGQNSVVLSGPSFAEELIRGQPTAVSIASTNMERALAAQKIFHSNVFRAYTSNDPIGLEICGALKNVIAIASGACKGLGFENNAQAALITRGLAEIIRVGTALGASPLTFNGLGGIGDLFLTCNSTKSRNYSLGFYIGQGYSVTEALNKLTSVAEGWSTSKAAFNLSKKLNTDTPLINEVYQVLHAGKPIDAAVSSLLERGMKPENHFP
jgi:glycerol-3-phosphate dehydrogenase (NAD(P)+)